MMHAFLWPLLTVAIAASGGAAPLSAWRKVFDGTSYGSVSSITAFGRDSWIAGGPWGLATANKDGTKVESTGGHGVLGLFADSPTNAYALGEGELIWHFDGKKWAEEHAGPLPPRGKRRPFAEHMLYLSYFDNTVTKEPMVAVGLSLVLVKQSDGTWSSPPEADRERMLKAGQLGPTVVPPPRCKPAGWHWFGRNRGALDCHDRRVFIFDSGRLVPKGKWPNKCYGGANSLVEARGELYASCSSLSLWKTEGEQWRRIESPRENALKEITSVSVADGCLFIARDKSVWRRCDQ